MLVLFIKVYIVLLFIQTLINVIQKKKRFSLLGCGLVGYCGKEAPDLRSIAMLLKFNDKRGEHATGVCINDTIWKKPVSASKFLRDYNFLFNQPPEVFKNFAVLGHARQASSGSKDREDLAHPHGIFAHDAAKNPILIGVHNGTVHNIGDLAKKHGIEHKINENSDSQTLFKIIAKYNNEEAFEVLGEYGGYATIMFYPMRAKNTIFVHRDPDRELYFWQKDEESIYISSVEDGLYAIGGTKETVFEFEPNIVFKFVAGQLKKEFKLPARKPYYTPYNNARTVNHASNVMRPVKGGAAQYGDYFQRANETVDQTKVRLEGKTNSRVGKSIPGNGFVFHNHRYFKNGHAYTGKFFLSENNTVYLWEDDAKKQRGTYKTIYVVGGVPMKDEKAAKELEFLCGDANGNYDPRKFTQQYPFKIKDYALYPVPAQLTFNTVIGMSFYTTEKFTKDFTWTPILSHETYTINSTCILNAIKKVKNVDVATSQDLEPVTAVSDKDKSFKELILEIAGEPEPQTFSSLWTEVRLRKGLHDNNKFYSDFIDEFLTMAVEDDIITDDTKIEIDTVGSVIEFNTVNCLDSLDTVLDKYYKYWEENLDEAPFDQTEFAYTGNHKPGNKDLKELSAEDYLDSFKEGTEHYYNNSQFYTEVSDGIPETIYDLITEWAESDEEKNVRPVVNSAALVLHDLGYISAKELTEIEAERINNAVGKVQGAYKLMKSVEADRKGKKQQVKKDPKDSMEKFSRIGAFSAGDSIAQLFHKLEFMVDNPTKCVPKEKEHIKDSLTFLINNCKSTDEQVLTNKYKLKKEQILEYLRKAS